MRYSEDTGYFVIERQRELIPINRVLVGDVHVENPVFTDSWRYHLRWQEVTPYSALRL